jgi:drug/metabolite transporter (DMT)-like permease
MEWLIFALIAAFCMASADSVCKRILKGTDEYIVAWARWVFALPPVLLILLFIKIPSLDAVFWTVMIIAGVLEVFGIILYTHAIKISPLSHTIPLLSIMPLLVVLSSFFY